MKFQETSTPLSGDELISLSLINKFRVQRLSSDVKNLKKLYVRAVNPQVLVPSIDEETISALLENEGFVINEDTLIYYD